jgi:hypothetical protein
VDAHGAVVGDLIGVQDGRPWILVPGGVAALALLDVPGSLVYYELPGCTGQAYVRVLNDGIIKIQVYNNSTVFVPTGPVPDTSVFPESQFDGITCKATAPSFFLMAAPAQATTLVPPFAIQ